MQVVPVESELAATLAFTAEAIEAARRDPHTRFADAVRETNYGRAPLLRPLCAADLAELDVSFACRHFSAAFSDPADFTLCLVGARSRQQSPTSARPALEAASSTCVPPDLSTSQLERLT